MPERQVFASLILYANADDQLFFDCLQSLKMQSESNFELIVIDNAWSPARREYLAGLNLPIQVSYHQRTKEKRYNVEIAWARNRGTQLAQSEIVIFSNDFMIFSRDFIKSHCAYHAQLPNICVIGQIEYLAQHGSTSQPFAVDYEERLNVSKDDKVIAKYNYSVFKDESIYQEVFPWGKAMAYNCSVAKEHVVKLGGFDESIAIYAASDADFIYRLHQMGIKIIKVAGAKSYQQDHVLYPTVRWRAGGSDYLPFKYQTENLFDYINIRQLERDIIDHNRYHSTKIALSKDFERRLTAYYLQKETQNCLQEGTGYHLPKDTQNYLPKETQNHLHAVASYHLPNKTRRGEETLLTLAILLDEQIELARVLPKLQAMYADSSQVEVIFWQMTKEINQELEVLNNCETCSFKWKYLIWEGQAELENLLQLKMIMPLVQKTSKNAAIQSIIQQNAQWVEKQWTAVQRDLYTQIAKKATGLYLKILKLSDLEKWPDRLEPLPTNLEKSRPQKMLKDYGITYRQPYREASAGFSLPPRAVSFRLTHKCNLNCKMCGQWGTQGNFKEKSREFVEAFLHLDKLKEVVDETATFRPGMYYIWGGEPLLHPDYLELIKYIKEKHIYCSTTTNGTLLAKYAEEICRTGTEFIRISIDGPERIHNQIRGRANCFQQSLEGIKRIHEIKVKNKLTYPILECDCVILPENYQYIEEYLDRLQQVPGLYSVNFSHPIYAVEETGHEHAAFFKEKFNKDAQSWRGFLMDMSTVDTGELIDIIQKVQNKSYYFPTNFDPPMKSLSDVHLHYRDIQTLYKNRFCTVPWIWVEIHPHGEVSFCEDFCDFYIGNIYEDTFLNIWNSPAAETYRQALLENRKFPICSHCGLLCHDADF